MFAGDPPESIPPDHLFQAALSTVDDAKAAEIYSVLLDVHDADNAAAWHNRALRYKRMGRLNDAETGYKQALRQNAESGLYVSSYARLLTEQGRRKEALPLLAEFLAKHPRHVRANETIGDILVETDPAKAVEHYLIAEDGGNDLSEHIVKLYRKLQQNDKEFERLRRLIKSRPTSCSVRSWKQRCSELQAIKDRERRQQSEFDRLRGQVKCVFALRVF